MLPVLWVEDEETEVAKYALDILDRIEGIEIHFLNVGREPLGSPFPGIVPHEVPECKECGGATLDVVSRALCAKYREIQPWLVLMDLAIDSIKNESPVFTLNGKVVPGVNLTLALYEQFGIQNIVFLSNYGQDILNDLKFNFTETREREFSVLRWPKTYFLAKSDLVGRAPGLQILEDLTKGAMTRLKNEGAIDLVPASQVQALFQLVSSHRSSLFHYVNDACRQGDGKLSRKFLNFELLAAHNPRLSVATWLWAQHGFTTRYNLNQLHNLNPRELTAKLEGLLADGFWGMLVGRFVERLRDENTSNPVRRTSDSLKLGSTLSTLRFDERVIGPIAQAAFWPAVRNAIENALKEGDTTIDCVPSANALYLFIRNTVDTSVDEVKAKMIRKAKDGVLHGIKQIRTAICDLNRLHKEQLNQERAFGQWGFALLFDGKLSGTYNPSAPDEDPFAFRAGATMDEAGSICCENGWSKDSVVAAFRLPLELPSHLGDPSLKSVAGRDRREGAKV